MRKPKLTAIVYSMLIPISVIIRSSIAQTLPTDTSTLFTGSGNCALCHVAGSDALKTQAGIDISPATLWRSTMMANAARDPLWRAKVSAEVAAHPALQSVIEDKCTTCHAPMGRTEAIYHGADHFSFQTALADPLSLDGVSCTLCHQIQGTTLGTDDSFSGKYAVKNEHKIFGPYTVPTIAPMFNQTGYSPVYAEHVHASELCATCHTLFTPYVDNAGQVAGYFPEQTPYLEWENSIYPAGNTECQTCHMPAINEAMKITNNPPWLTTQRSPVWAHEFAGGNVFINTIIEDHGAEIGVTASTAQFDSTISKTTRMLQQQTINLSATAEVIEDTILVDVKVENLSGHKFPTGFPSRRAWLHLVIRNSENDIIFESGKWDQNGEIIGLDPGYEPHQDLITSEEQIQIYESVMKDVDGQVTYTLLRGAQYAKDNRLPPKGFTRAAAGYASVQICGNAVDDNNFNRTENGTEGSGSDQIRYKFAVNGKGTPLFVTVEMRYQTLSPRFARDLFLYETDHTTQFKNYYDAVDNSPVSLRSVTLNVLNTGIHDRQTVPAKFGQLRNYPNPFNPSTRICLDVSQSGHIRLRLFNLLGEEVATLVDAQRPVGSYEFNFDAANLPSGIYLCKLESGNEIKTMKILLTR